ncbi:hypothetical protein GCM10009854_43530 [Saccharopolyspora halophila]|uniref:Uncharacterized protein n=1 Tax=Saccharopolyspora halophila TaxID=405551 RepID=A0ABN3GSQ0_9PSEU
MPFDADFASVLEGFPQSFGRGAELSGRVARREAATTGPSDETLRAAGFTVEQTKRPVPTTRRTCRC